MMNFIKTLLLVMVSNFAFAGEPDKELHTKCIYPTVWLSCKETKSTGSGVIVSSQQQGDKWINKVYTCDHVAEDTQTFFYLNNPTPQTRKLTNVLKVAIYEDWSTLKSYEQYTCKLIHSDSKNDIAVVSFESSREMPVAEIDKCPKLYIGNEVFRVGCGLNAEFRLDYGRITSLNYPDDTGKLRTSIFTVFGDSGGPVFHENKVIGICRSVSIGKTHTGADFIATGISFATKIDLYPDP